MSNSPPTPSEDACSRHVHINPSHLDNLLRLFLALAQHMEVMLPELEQYDCLKCEHCGNVTHGTLIFTIRSFWAFARRLPLRHQSDFAHGNLGSWNPAGSPQLLGRLHFVPGAHDAAHATMRVDDVMDTHAPLDSPPPLGNFNDFQSQSQEHGGLACHTSATLVAFAAAKTDPLVPLVSYHPRPVYHPMTHYDPRMHGPKLSIDTIGLGSLERDRWSGVTAYRCLGVMVLVSMCLVVSAPIVTENLVIAHILPRLPGPPLSAWDDQQSTSQQMLGKQLSVHKHRHTGKNNGMRVIRDTYYSKHRAATEVSTLLGIPVPRELVDRAGTTYRASFSVNRISREPEDPWDSEEATLGAYQYTEIILSAHNRQDKWLAHNGDLMELEGEVLTEVEARVKAWILLWEDVTSGAGDGDLKMKWVALNWGEKVVTMLAEEWQEWVTDRAAWCRALKSGNLPWQQMMRETMSLYTKEVSDV
ncbi:hypothetical protein PYCCODRAFT_1429170 [Trametes coccinea BRFM310]|uniref:Uncharacterized protein n=1 Tax=Trametes coccinea (strain BRFM310) TaxID=1353009 RepID=A0A1Y2I7D8_TRAC3|nr:hypothetical protein PYCCODRAFT_1429170 [Trametes coccinea BRFM310]